MAERRCDAHVPQADSYGGVLSMLKGTALFEAMTISDTEASVRGGAGRRCESGRRALGRVSADGVQGRLQ